MDRWREKRYRSDFSLHPADRNIDVALRYELKLMYNIFGINNIPVIARAVISRWSGVTRIEQSDEEADEDTDCVYITKMGLSIIYIRIAPICP